MARESLEQTKKYVIEQLPTIIFKLDTELSEIHKKHHQNNYFEEGYHKDIGQVYQLKLIDDRFQNLVMLYKSNEPGIGQREKENIKKMITLCNTGLILKIISGLNTENDGGVSKGELIAEGYQSLIDSIEKFEIDFTHEKSTKNTSIKMIEKNEEGFIVEIKSNKPFGNLDIKIKNLEEKTTEEFNEKIIWEEDGQGYVSKFLLSYENLENDYVETSESKIKFSVSKKVGHISTFLTNNIFFSQKNYLNKASPIKISNNYQILRNQMLKIKEVYEENFDKEPSERWIAYYLLTQNRLVGALNKKKYRLYKKYFSENITESEKKEILKEIDINSIDMIIKKYQNQWIYISTNQDTKRILMIKNKGVADKNKNNFTGFGGNNELIGNEDEIFYEKEFEKLIEKKISEIGKIKHYQGVEQLDKENDDGESYESIIGDDSQVKEMINEIDLNYQKKEIYSIAKGLLTPQEYYYFSLYFTNKIDFEKFVVYKDGVSTVKSTLRKAFTKIMFYLQYKNLINN